MKTEAFKKILLAAIVSGAAVLAPGVHAASFNLAGNLTGDPRYTYDGGSLDIAVTIAVSNNIANWTVDIVNPTYPSVHLDEFYFNLNLAGATVGFSNYIPSNWEVTSPGSTVGLGGGTPDFLFQANDPAPPGTDVTALQNLSFTATLSRDWTLNDFLLASPTCSLALATPTNLLGCGQMGAHLQGLTGTADSGFLLGNYEEKTTPICGPGTFPCEEVPEPNALALLGIGLLTLGFQPLRKVCRA